MTSPRKGEGKTGWRTTPFIKTAWTKGMGGEGRQIEEGGERIKEDNRRIIGG